MIIDESNDLIDIDALKNDDLVTQISKLRLVKNCLIGCLEKKDQYFNMGIIESLMPQVSKIQDPQLLLETLTILNCYFFDFPKAIDCFKCY